MKRILFKSFAIAAMALISGNAWAEWDETSAVYCPELETAGQTANFDDLNKALDAANKYSNTNTSFTSATLELYNDVALTARLTHDNKNKITTLSIVPKADNLTISCSGATSWHCFLINKVSSTFKIGSSEHKLTIANTATTNWNKYIFSAESSGTIELENLTIKDFKFTTSGYLFANKNNGQNTLILRNVDIDNCTANTDDCLIKYNRTANSSGIAYSDVIYLQESVNFNNCSGICIDTANRIRLGAKGGSENSPTFSSNNPISILWSSNEKSIGTGIVAKGASRKEYFTLVNEDLGLFASTDLKLTQAYTVETKSDAQGAATLILPFESTIPDGVKAYKLNSVTDNTIATEDVTSKLPADTPVLINTKAEGGKYKFVSTNTTKDAEFATGSEAKTEGLLTGVYTETTVAEGNYILAKGDKGVGFYKSKGSSKVEANHAYLTIDNSSDSAKSSFFRVIGGGDGGTTLIKGIETNEEKAQEGVYNLNGVRMDKPERKGIYIVNGKKRIVK